MRFLGIMFAALLTVILASSTAWAVVGQEPSKPQVFPISTSQEQYKRVAEAGVEITPVPPLLAATVVLTSYEGVTVLSADVTTPTLRRFLAAKGYRLRDYRGDRGQVLRPERKLAPGATVFLFKVEYQSSYEQIKLTSPIEEIASPFMPTGNRVVLEEGAPGTALLTKVAAVDLSSFKRVNATAKNKARKRSTVETVTVVQAPTPTTMLVGSGVEDLDPTTVKGFLYPVPEPYVTSPFGMRVHPVTGIYKLHDGMDLAANCGAPITAAASGVVLKSEYNGPYGNQVQIDNGGGFVTSYSHLTSSVVKVGDVIEAGAPIGNAGATGLVTGCHLHFMTTLDGVPLDPMGFFSE